MRKEDTHVYYLTELPNTTNGALLASFSDQRSSPILQNMSKYHMSCLRFSVPTQSIPIFNMNSNTEYSITLSIGSDDYTANVVFVSDNNADSSDKGVYTIADFMAMINTAATSAFDALKLAHGAVTSTVGPKFIYSPSTRLIQMRVQQSYVSDAISIYINVPMMSKFGYQFPYKFYGYNIAKAYLLRVFDTGDNSTTISGTAYYIMYQELEALAQMTDVQKIVFTSNISVKSEGLNTNDGNSSDNFRLILQSMEPMWGGGGDSQPQGGSGVVQYFPASEFRLMDLESTQPLTNFNFQVSWADKQNVLSPIYLEPGTTLTAYWMFSLKE